VEKQQIRHQPRFYPGIQLPLRTTPSRCLARSTRRTYSRGRHSQHVQKVAFPTPTFQRAAAAFPRHAPFQPNVAMRANHAVFAPIFIQSIIINLARCLTLQRCRGRGGPSRSTTMRDVVILQRCRGRSGRSHSTILCNVVMFKTVWRSCAELGEGEAPTSLMVQRCKHRMVRFAPFECI
jgi:hypothetical protein